MFQLSNAELNIKLFTKLLRSLKSKVTNIRTGDLCGQTFHCEAENIVDDAHELLVLRL